MSDPFVLVLSIGGMRCEGCVEKVKEALSAVPGVNGVLVDLASGRAEVTPGDIRAPAVVAAVEAAGFTAKIISANPYTGL